MLLKNKLYAFPGFREESGDGSGGSAGGTGSGGDGGTGDTGLDWRSALPESISGNNEAMTTLKSFNSYEDLVNGVVGAQRMLGSRIPIPGENADEATMKEFQQKLSKVPGVMTMPNADDEAAMSSFYSKLGRPESANDYKYERMDGLEYDDAQEKWFFDTAHKMGFSQQQASGLMKAWDERNLASVNESNQATAAAKTALEQKWGAGYDQNIGIAKTVIKQFGGDDLAEQVGASVESNPALAEMFFTLGKLTLEDSVIKTLSGGDSFRTMDEVKQEMADINGNAAYFNKKDPAHASLVSKMATLHQEIQRLSGG